MLTCPRGANPAADCGLLHSCKESFKEDIPTMEMRHEIDAADLAMARKVRDQKRCADRTAQVAHEVADSGDLVVVLLAHADVGERADWYEDQGQSNHLKDAHPDYGGEVYIRRNAHHPEHAHRGQQES